MLTEKEMMQVNINNECIGEYEKAYVELMRLDEEQRKLNGKGLKGKRLNSCTAWVFETPNYYVLKSYKTYVAVLNKETDTVYDLLRFVYGYTATSAKHIAKFDHQYGQGKWGATNRLTARCRPSI